MNEQAPPVSAGEQHEVSIHAVGEKGDGIAKVKGFVLFVSGVKKGDYVKVKITKVLAKVGFAEVVEKLEKPKKIQKFATINEEELQQEKAEEQKYSQQEDTDDFGADLEED